MTRAGLALALLISIYAALLFADLIGQSINEFRSHVSPRSDDVETATRAARGEGTGGGYLVRSHAQISSRFLSSGSEGAL